MQANQNENRFTFLWSRLHLKEISTKGSNNYQECNPNAKLKLGIQYRELVSKKDLIIYLFNA